MSSSSKSLASMPPMGWNSWNTFGHNINETVVRETADALVSTGLRDYGYEFIVIDDCWSVKEQRDSNGDLIPDPEKFPNGIKALADYVHNKGFKLGIYSDAAEKTCAGYPGSYGFEGKGQIAGTGMSYIEYQTHMSLWCMACSPLMIGCDVRKLDSDTASLLMNREVLSVNQDPLGIPAKRVKQIGTSEIWTKRLSDSSVAVSIINRGSHPEDVTIRARDIGMVDTPKLARNLWTQEDIADFTIELTQRVQPYETVLFKVS